LMPLASVDLMAVSCLCPKNVQARDTRRLAGKIRGLEHDGVCDELESTH
jgi:hypothetical protein